MEYMMSERGAYGRRSEGYDGLGRRVWVHVTGPNDVSPAHVTYPTGYDDRCGWCWLGGAHSGDEHARRIAAAS